VVREKDWNERMGVAVEGEQKNFVERRLTREVARARYQSTKSRQKKEVLRKKKGYKVSR